MPLRKRRHRLVRTGVLGGLFGLSFGLAAGCGSASPKPLAPQTGTASTAASSAAEEALPPRSTATPGRVQCGSASCDLSAEVCCTNGEGVGKRCVPKPKDPNQVPCKNDEMEKHCDERSDCARGSVCCRTYDCSGGCPPKFECEPTRCQVEVSETCLGNDGCSEGFECKSGGARDAPAFCELTHPGAPCGKKRCGGSTPICRTDASKATAACVAEVPDDLGPPDDSVAYYACASAADCGGYACGKMAVMPYRVFHCAAPGFAGDRFWPILCAAVADCPAHWGKTATGCAAPAEGNLLAGVKSCVYPEDE
ncbi:MAG: hypothetical protein R3B13_02415 [Polyangiaceae bacterium]